MSKKATPDYTQLAVDAIDLWQDHLTALASDPKAKADLAKLLEPQRRLFAEWMEKAQTMAHGAASLTPSSAYARSNETDGAAAVRAASDDGAISVAQLALYIAELDERVAQLESKSAAAGKSAGASKPKPKS